LRRLQASERRVSDDTRREVRGEREGDALVRLLPDVERELLEPVGRLGHLVDADDHAPRLDLGPADVVQA